MRNTTTKRLWMAAMGLVMLGALGACSDQPMAPEEPYEVQMDGATAGNGNCIWIEGQMHCEG